MTPESEARPNGKKPRSDPDGPNLQGKVALVTGATSGIGEVTAIELARRGMKVILAGRTEAKVAEARRHVLHDVPEAPLESIHGDLSSMAEVRRVADTVLQLAPRLDLLVNNAGCYRSRRTVTPDGFEETWAVNYLAPFLLTRLLLPRLRASAPSRIVNVASEAHRHARPDWIDLIGYHRYSGLRAYSESKLALILFTEELARRITGSGVTVNAVHPGMVRSQFGSEGVGVGRWVLRRTIEAAGMSPEEGAQTSIYVATAHEIDGVTGAYFSHLKRLEPSDAAQDPVVAHRLWELTEKLVQLPPLSLPDEEPAGGVDARSLEDGASGTAPKRVAITPVR